MDNIVIKKRERFLENVDRVIKLCSETSSNTDQKYSLLGALNEIKTPNRCMDYIAKSCKALGVSLR